MAGFGLPASAGRASATQDQYGTQVASMDANWYLQNFGSQNQFHAANDPGEISGYSRTRTPGDNGWMYSKSGPAAAAAPPAAAPAGAAPPPAPGGADPLAAAGGGSTGFGSRTNMPSADFSAPSVPMDMGSTGGAEGGGYRQGSPGALNPRLGTPQRGMAMSALASMPRIY